MSPAQIPMPERERDLVFLAAVHETGRWDEALTRRPGPRNSVCPRARSMHLGSGTIPEEEPDPMSDSHSF